MKISVITTTYNRKDFLLETIESVQKSVFLPRTDIEFEHIIYDDASTDGTQDLFTTDVGKNVVYIRSEENRGPSYGRNRAIERATGTHIFLIDSDDIILQRTLYNFAVLATNHPDIQWFVSDFVRTNEQLQYKIGHDYYHWDFKNPEEALRSIFRGEHFIQSNVFFSKSLFLRVGGFDETMRMAEDLDLFIRFFLENNMPITDSFVSHLHRNHSNNLSVGVDTEKHRIHMQDIQKKYQVELKKRGII